MSVDEIMAELQAMGSESIKKILLRHGVKEPFFGVKVAQLKTIQKKIKKNYQLAKDLFATGNADAMYLAGLIADDENMTKADLQLWANRAISNNISEYTVPWVAAGNQYGFELAVEWIDDHEEHIAATGWSTLANIVSLRPDSELNTEALLSLLIRVEQTIHSSPNRVRSTMNSFIISTGIYVASLNKDAITVAQQIGIVKVAQNGTACEVPSAVNYIKKAMEKQISIPKKKTVKC